MTDRNELLRQQSELSAAEGVSNPVLTDPECQSLDGVHVNVENENSLPPYIPHGNSPSTPTPFENGTHNRRASGINENQDVNPEDDGHCLGKALKIFLYCLLFVVILGCSMISQGTLLYASSNIYDSHPHDAVSSPWTDPSFPLMCLDYRSYRLFNDKNSTDHTNCVAVPPPYSNFSMQRLEHCVWPRNTSFNEHVIPKSGSSTYLANMCRFSSAQWVWCLFLIVCIPYVFTFVRCLWYSAFRKSPYPNPGYCVVVVLLECGHSIGLCMFLFNVLPRLGNVLEACVLMPAVAFVPSFLAVVQLNKGSGEKKWWKILLDILACLTQLCALLIWPTLIGLGKREGHDNLVYTIPISLFLISLGWWQNFIEWDPARKIDSDLNSSFMQDVTMAKTKINLIISPIKIVLSLGILAVSQAVKTDVPLSIGDVFSISFDKCNDELTSDPQIGKHEIPSIGSDWLWVCLINIISGLCAYFAARAAAKAKLQKISYALPLCISSPLVMVWLLTGCNTWIDNPCAFDGPTYYFFKCYSSSLSKAIVDQQLYMVMFFWLSQLWITRHIWFQANERLARTDKLFVSPLYDGVFLEQSLLYNRKRNDEPSGVSSQKEMSDIETPMIYLCATMWHEEKEEMINLLKSVYRMDIDHFARTKFKEDMNQQDPDYYNFEAHIFFDDAIGPKEKDEDENNKATISNDVNGNNDENTIVTNKYVKQLVKAINEAKSQIYKTEKDKPDEDLIPTKYITPYGGRLEWNLPGGNKLVAHLKDKKKIRIKKRWSQVMYMNYFLGHQLLDKQQMPNDEKAIRAHNTFLLALDGDVDFEPLAVTLLVDLMKRNPKLGAACGRIHPTGSGPMVWYQKFEYALGHWMQKATEHVIGCVLCSPGCFSLFRGEAIMHDIMDIYATTSEKAKDYIQYDQGEDRWLCTLMLQKGYRVEYCAASDAYTAAPESFKEFYNQRRRWGPSTMANIIDLITSWKKTTKNNESLSFLYIVYQTVFLLLSLMGPGTIFLMMVGALEVALNDQISMWTSFIINLIPIVIFVIMCFTTKCDTQVGFAFVLTGMYTIVQMIVLVGVCIQMSEQGPCSPPFIFFFYVAGTFLLAAILHPQEFFCVVHGFTYFLAIPSMYMLLIIYSMCNLNVTSWGTREKKTSDPDKTKQQQQEASTKESESPFANVLAMGTQAVEEGFTISLGNMFRCICCPREKTTVADPNLQVILHKLNMMDDNDDLADETEVSADDADNLKGDHTMTQTAMTRTTRMTRKKTEKKARVMIIEPVDDTAWIRDPELGDGSKKRLNDKEESFFNELIEDTLPPITPKKKEQEEVTADLKELRNAAAGAFLMLNAIFTVTISVLQLNMDTLAVPWPCGDNLTLEPIGFMFLVLFVTIMLLQTFGMLIHRGGTLLHTAATTNLNDKSEQEALMKELQENMKALAKPAAQEIINVPEAVDSADPDAAIMIRTQTIVQRATRKRKTTRRKLTGPSSIPDGPRVPNRRSQAAQQIDEPRERSGTLSKLDEEGELYEDVERYQQGGHYENTPHFMPPPILPPKRRDTEESSL